MRFDEKPKRRSLHLGKSRVDVSREDKPSRSKRISRPTKSLKPEKEEFAEDLTVYFREKPEKLPEGYEEDETFSESLKGAMKNHAPLVVAGAALLVAIGFFTGFIPGLFKHDEPETNTVSAAAEPTERTKYVFTQGKFNLSTENTDAGIETVCETTTDEEGNEKKVCRTKTEADKKKEQEEKEREEQEKKAKEEREKEEIEDKAKEELKQKQAEAAAKEKTTEKTAEKTTTDPGPIRVTGITSISGCPAEVVAGSVVVLKASALPSSAANANIIWSATSSASVIYDSTGNVATVSVGSGERVIVTAMTIDGGYSEHCSFPIVSELTR